MAFAKITTLTPIHVGSGQVYSRDIEFIEEGGGIGLIDPNKVGDLIGHSKADIDQWVRAIENKVPLIDFLRNNRGLKNVTIEEISERVLDVKGNSRGIKQLRAQMFSSIKGLTIPGSSIKGAIRTAILNYLINQNNVYALDLSIYKKSFYDHRKHKTQIDYSGSNLEKRYFGNDSNHDIFRFLRTGDVYFDHSICICTRTLNETGTGHEIKGSVSQLVECIDEGLESVFQISVSENLIRELSKNRYLNIRSKLPNLSLVSDLKGLFRIINSFTGQQIEKEINLYENLNLPSEVNQFVDTLKEIKQQFQILNDHECILRLGFGIGYLNMTGGWPLEQWKHIPGINLNRELDFLSEAVRRKSNYNGTRLPKSRKLGNEGVPLGFIKLSLVDDRVYHQWNENREKCRQLVEQRRIDQREEEKRLREQQEEEARLAAEEAKKPQMFTGRLKVGVTLDAEVVQSGTPNLVKVYVPGYENKNLQMQLYRGSLPVGTIVEVEVNNFDRKQNRIVSVKYVKMKT